MDKRVKLVISWGLISICLVQIGIFVAKYIKLAMSIRNPLIPEGIVNYVGKQTIGICLLYVLAMLPNIFYLIKRRSFTAACVLSVVLLFLIQFFMAEITAMLS